MKKINALHGQGFAHPVASQHDISANRKQVIPVTGRPLIAVNLRLPIWGCATTVTGWCGCVPACPCMRQTMM